ncbi:MAG: carboxylating nicotinate-nucleotide diphosphorylase [Candidatus Margulisbacteria bacterium]|nr:carboxylating nicotinate-nucleotide diphosphorylase [Candidatus Margulisiibacteriota bacterium]
MRLALVEDGGRGDITSRVIIPAGQKAKAVIRTKENGVVCGLGAAREVFRQIDRRIRFSAKVKDGTAVKAGTVIATVSGPARGILTGERVALNFLQHLSGIATLTRAFVSRVTSRGSRVRILDTRKTIPGMRVLEKYAVKMGGGVNHRMGLYDAILIKDNHIKLAGGVVNAIRKAKAEAKAKAKGIEAEAKTIAQVQQAIAAGADRILLDNMSIRTLRQAVKLCKKAGVKTEASGGVNLNNIAAIAKTGVDYISVGALTHSARALDISLKIV